MTIHVFGGGTLVHVRNHFSLCAPAYGSTAHVLFKLLQGPGLWATVRRWLHRLTGQAPRVQLHLTKMACAASSMETNDDVAQRLDQVLADPHTRAIIFNVALCDFEGQIGDVPSGKYAERLQSRGGVVTMTLTPASKLLARVKAQRPDVLLVGFKTTAGEPPAQQEGKSARQMAESGADLVLANDTVTRHNMVFAVQDGTLKTVIATPHRRHALTCLACEVQDMLEKRERA